MNLKPCVIEIVERTNDPDPLLIIPNEIRINGGKVKFWYELDRPQNAIEDAFKAYVEQVRQSNFTLLIGKA